MVMKYGAFKRPAGCFRFVTASTGDFGFGWRDFLFLAAALRFAFFRAAGRLFLFSVFAERRAFFRFAFAAGLFFFAIFCVFLAMAAL